MNRREFLQCAALAITGASASQLGFALSEEQRTFMASAPNYNSAKLDFLSEAQRKIISAMAEIIIPRTDTPGAIDAGVPAFIELMAADWFNEQERSIFTAGLQDLETRIPKSYGATFDQLDGKKQLQVMQELETAAEDASWYGLQALLGGFDSDTPFICQVKELTIWGFFTSEVGCKEVLRYNPMPMQFDGELPLSPDDSTWGGGMGL